MDATAAGTLAMIDITAFKFTNINVCAHIQLSDATDKQKQNNSPSRSSLLRICYAHESNTCHRS